MSCEEGELLSCKGADLPVCLGCRWLSVADGGIGSSAVGEGGVDGVDGVDGVEGDEGVKGDEGVEGVEGSAVGRWSAMTGREG